MPVNPNAEIEVTGFNWVPDGPRGLVKDLRVRWALEEAGLDYRFRGIGLERPANYRQDQPFEQVPCFNDGKVRIFESGAIVQYVAEKSEALLPRDPQQKYRAIQWSYAALSSIEPFVQFRALLNNFWADLEWAPAAKPTFDHYAKLRLQQLSDRLGDKDWLEGDRFTIGDLTFLSGAFRRLRTLLEGLLIGFSQVAGAALYLDDLFSFFEIRPEIVSAPDAIPFPNPMREGFRFENVGFRYPGAERWAVRNLDFTLHASEVLALVGENGAGKTTLVKLLARLYDPDEGRILVDGVDLREYDLAGLRSNVGVIFQDFVRYQMTAAENIAVGRIEARDDRARIVSAATSSLADGVIRKLRDGYDQQIGKRLRNGVELSGGEWQKLAIARAYMRDAQILILDEPTAALDARAEYEVFERFRELSEGKTAVLISHRFSSVRMADRILVLAEGRIEAAGTHEELLQQSARYAELFELQAAGYR